MNADIKKIRKKASGNIYFKQLDAHPWLCGLVQCQLNRYLHRWHHTHWPDLQQWDEITGRDHKTVTCVRPIILTLTSIRWKSWGTPLSWAGGWQSIITVWILFTQWFSCEQGISLHHGKYDNKLTWMWVCWYSDFWWSLLKNLGNRQREWLMCFHSCHGDNSKNNFWIGYVSKKVCGQI